MIRLQRPPTSQVLPMTFIINPTQVKYLRRPPVSHNWRSLRLQCDRLLISFSFLNTVGFWTVGQTEQVIWRRHLRLWETGMSISFRHKEVNAGGGVSPSSKHVVVQWGSKSKPVSVSFVPEVHVFSFYNGWFLWFFCVLPQQCLRGLFSHFLSISHITPTTD